MRDVVTGPRLVVRPISGLCNRLQVISSFEVLGRRAGRTLQVCWSPSPGWSDEDLGELFENVFPRVTQPDFEVLCERALPLHDVVTVSRVSGQKQTWTWTGDARLDDVFDVASYPVVTYRGFQRADWLIPPQQRGRSLPNFPRDYVAAVRTWRPVASIRAAVDALAAGFGGHTVGVHVRRGDAWRHPVLWSEYRRSSDAAFFSRMDRLLGIDPDTTFFLATDCRETEERFRRRYGSVLLANPEKRFVRSVSGEPKENQRDAVVDLFTLSRTCAILGSHYSTFSRMAAAIGDVSLDVALGESWTDVVRRASLHAWRGVRRRAASGRRAIRAGGSRRER